MMGFKAFHFAKATFPGFSAEVENVKILLVWAGIRLIYNGLAHILNLCRSYKKVQN
jgi:hypothetical protein